MSVVRVYLENWTRFELDSRLCCVCAHFIEIRLWLAAGLATHLDDNKGVHNAFAPDAYSTAVVMRANKRTAGQHGDGRTNTLLPTKSTAAAAAAVVI